MNSLSEEHAGLPDAARLHQMALMLQVEPVAGFPEEEEAGMSPGLRQALDQSRRVAIKLGQWVPLAMTEFQMGLHYSRWNDPQGAKHYFRQARDYAERANHKRMASLAIFAEGLMRHRLYDHEGAFACYQDTLKRIESQRRQLVERRLDRQADDRHAFLDELERTVKQAWAILVDAVEEQVTQRLYSRRTQTGRNSTSGITGDASTTSRPDSQRQPYAPVTGPHTTPPPHAGRPVSEPIGDSRPVEEPLTPHEALDVDDMQAILLGEEDEDEGGPPQPPQFNFSGDLAAGATAGEERGAPWEIQTSLPPVEDHAWLTVETTGVPFAALPGLRKGDWLIVKKQNRDYNRGDLVIVRHPERAPQAATHVKAVAEDEPENSDDYLTAYLGRGLFQLTENQRLHPPNRSQATVGVVLGFARTLDPQTLSGLSVPQALGEHGTGPGYFEPAEGIVLVSLEQAHESAEMDALQAGDWVVIDTRQRATGSRDPRIAGNADVEETGPARADIGSAASARRTPFRHDPVTGEATAEPERQEEEQPDHPGGLPVAFFRDLRPPRGDV